MASVPISGVEWRRDGFRVLIGSQTREHVRSLTLDAASLEVQKSRDLGVVVDHSSWTLSPNGVALALTKEEADPTDLVGSSWLNWLDLYDCRSGKRLNRNSCCRAQSLVFSPDGTCLFVGAETCGPYMGDNGNWQLWNATRIEQIHLLKSKNEPVQSALWTHDGALVWLALNGGGDLFSYPAEGKLARHLNPFGSTARDEYELTAFALAPDDKVFAIASAKTSVSGSVDLVDAHSGRILKSWVFPLWVTQLAFSPRNYLLAMADSNKVGLRSWRQNTTRELIAPNSTALAFSPDGSHLAVGTSKGEVQIWRIQ